MTPSPGSDRPRIYADEDIDRPLIEPLRARGFDVLTVQSTRSFGEDDLAQLEPAAAAGRVLLTFNRRHFRRHTRIWLEDGRVHPGIVTILQGLRGKPSSVDVGDLHSCSEGPRASHGRPTWYTAGATGSRKPPIDARRRASTTG